MALTATLTQRILAHLHITPAPPAIPHLERLIRHYGRHVPWESASRIAKRARVNDPATAARWSDEFWDDAIRHGTGGTCFESNRAFLELLTELGYHGYLTINDMGETMGCHTAIIIRHNNQSWLVDVGYPIYGALPLDPQRETERTTPYMTYHARPIAPDRYTITNQPHPKPYAFDLIDHPIDDTTYRQATIADYGPNGLFLQRLILRKIVEGAIWRFDSEAHPPHLEQFHAGERNDHPLDHNCTATLSQHFGISATIIDQAWQALAR